MKQLIILILTSLLIFSCSSENSDIGSQQGTSGTQSGSYANMLAVGEFLYMVSESQLITYSLQEKDKPVEVNRQSLGFGIESLFVLDKFLFVGSQTAMYIYEIGTDGVPSERSTTDYIEVPTIRPCDPIVADENIAYVTLSTSTRGVCGSLENVNELRVYDIEDLDQPALLTSYAMQEPKGLGLDDDLLFVCEANNGLKVFDVSDPTSIILLHHFEGYKAIDVIASSGLLIVIGPDNLYQYDYTDISNMAEISRIQL